jgi:hypothetical protein
MNERHMIHLRLAAHVSLLLLAIWYPSVATGQQTSSSIVTDPIVGVWTMDTMRGETYEYLLTIRADGTVRNRLMREEFEGTWKRLKNGRYIMPPGGDDDYVVLRNGTLEEWDKTGFIRSFHRVRPPVGSNKAAALAHTAKLKRAAQSWIYATFTPGMRWKGSTIREFVDHAGEYTVSKARPPYHRAFYFPQPDITILVDDDRGVAMLLREGRPIQ